MRHACAVCGCAAWAVAGQVSTVTGPWQRALAVAHCPRQTVCWCKKDRVSCTVLALAMGQHGHNQSTVWLYCLFWHCTT